MSPLSPKEDKREWIESALLELRLGHLDEAGRKMLHDLLLEDAEARRFYLEAQQMDALLESAAVTPELGFAENVVQPSNRQRNPRAWAAVAALGFAACLTVLLILPSPREVGSGATVHAGVAHEDGLALLRLGNGAQLAGTPAGDGDWIEGGKVAVEKGSAELTFRSGAKMVMEEGCRFEVVDADTLVLERGKIWVHCPLEARGFRVLTSTGREIIDLGTEFGVAIDDDGGMKVHVFDGAVDVVEPDKASQRLVEGAALQWQDHESAGERLAADRTGFMTPEVMARHRWSAYREHMLQREDLLLYYDFAEVGEGGGQIVTNRAKGHSGVRNGKTIRTIPVAGRFDQSRSLLLDHPGSSVAVNVSEPKGLDQLTIALWIKVDRFQNRLGALFNANGWEPGALHFHVTNDGSLRAGWNGGPALESHSGVVRAGEWHLVAVTHDFLHKQSRLYVDGQALSTLPFDNRAPRDASATPRLGPSQIGFWGNSIPTVHRWRGFKGRIDEVMVFDRALEPSAMADLHAAGRP